MPPGQCHGRFAIMVRWSHTYANALWSVWGLLTVFAFTSVASAGARLHPLPLAGLAPGAHRVALANLSGRVSALLRSERGESHEKLLTGALASVSVLLCWGWW